MFQISARNQFTGTVIAVKEGAISGVVTIDLGGSLIKSDITMASIRNLGIREGVTATAIVKATSVCFSTYEGRISISANNQFKGVVTQVDKGAVHGNVCLTTPDGLEINGTITLDAINDLGLTEGREATAIIKSSDVLIGIDR